MKAVILSRVSSKEQEEGHSIDAQLNRLRDYSDRKNFSVIKEFRLVESSTRGDRPEFYAMVDFIKKQKETIAVVVDAVDRLQRGFKETPIFDEMLNKNKIELHFLRESLVFTVNSKSSEKMMWDFSTLTAKAYVGALSDNVKRSIEKKLQEGTITGSAPLGYLNVTRDDGKKMLFSTLNELI